MKIGKLIRKGVARAWRAPQPSVQDLDPAERSFRSIWRYVKFTSSKYHQPKRTRQNVLVLQMGKVASLAIQDAIAETGLNAFHSHTLALPRQQRLLERLVSSPMTFDLASHQFRLHIHNAALRLMVRWFEANKRYCGHRLKVVTLCRDPVNQFRANFIQLFEHSEPGLLAWQRARSRLPPDAPVNLRGAVRDLV